MRRAIFYALALLNLVGCASYQACDLLDEACFSASQGDMEELSVAIKVFDRKDCYTYLDRDVLRLGYQPIQLTFENCGAMSFIYDRHLLSLPSVSVDEVAAKAHTSTKGRALMYGIPSLLCPFLIVPAFVDAIMSAHANERLDCDFACKARDRMVIPPGHIAATLVFVPIQLFDAEFSLTLQDASGAFREISAP